jgi:hypothetical protein
VILYVPIIDHGTPSVGKFDAAYLNVSQTNACVFWISGRALMNHCDTGVGHLNWFDIEGVPGDAPAQLRIAGLAGELAQRYQGHPYNFVQNYEAEDATLPAGIAAHADAAYSGGSCAQTPNTLKVHADNALLCTFAIAANLIDQFGELRILAFWGAEDNTSPTGSLRADIVYGTSTTLAGEWCTDRVLNGASSRFVDDLGVIHMPPQGVPRGSTITQVLIRIYYALSPGGSTKINLDNIYLVPLEEGYVMGGDGADPAVGPNVIDSTCEPPTVYKLSTITDDASALALDPTSLLGVPLEAEPGVQNRFYWRNGLVLATAGNVRAKIRARRVVL